ncbi:hypothetical protein FPV67DRAFT_1452397 [Lyophyllum atratum]|nr:hypothetical protein FPV67DRAFT_1452397 [Lyophyllum atratum]
MSRESLKASPTVTRMPNDCVKREKASIVIAARKEMKKLFLSTWGMALVSRPQHAVDIWKQIEREFPFFPTLHRIFAFRPNITLIVVTTALGPQGQKTVWYQPPDDNSNIDPNLLKESLPAAPLTPGRERSFANDASGCENADAWGLEPASQPANIIKLMTPGSQRDCPVMLWKMHAKPLQSFRRKCSLADTLLEIQRYFLF